MRQFLAICAVVASCAVVTGCETMQPASYANYGDNSYALKHLQGARVRVSSMSDLSNFDSGCRMVGPIKTAGSRSIADFIKDSINDEFKFAGVYSDESSAVQLNATLEHAQFSSLTDLTRGYWSFALQLTNPATGKTVAADIKYDFDSGFDATTACMNTSNALTPAVQRLINKTFTDPSFPELIGH